MLAVLALTACGGGSGESEAGTPVSGPSPSPAPPPSDGSAVLEAAPASGWAAGATGGQSAAASSVYTVSTATELLAAISAGDGKPVIIKVSGTIDMAAADNGGAFTSRSDQSTRSRVPLKSNTTLIGAGTDAALVNGWILIRSVDNVIVRNLRIVNPCDVAPEWDPDDGDTGNWNGEFDGMTIEGATHVWVDHNTFTDAPLTDDQLPIANGKTKQCHDGALDIKSGADYVTVSSNLFDRHDKNNLVGSSDSAGSTDDGHLRVTFAANRFSAITQRAPRVRFGQVHVFNNLYEGSKSDAVYPHAYSLGVGYKAKIISENNVFEIAGASGCADVATNPGSSSKPGAITDSGSTLNGAALSLSACGFDTAVGWTVPYSYGSVLMPVSSVAASVRSNAGAGKLSVSL
jgi:pectate lyase